MRIYIGNLPYTCTADEVRELFSSYGNVESVNLITDRETGRPRGFGFVEMTNGGESAVSALHAASFGGRTLTVNEARPREREPRRERSSSSW
jgi:RNA recognition motif-containing protein